MNKKLLLVGVGSLVGRRLVALDLSAYEVFCTTRDSQKCIGDGAWINFDLDKMDGQLSTNDFDMCIYMADLPKIFTLLQAGLRVKKIVAYSTSSVLTKADSCHERDIDLVNSFEKAQLGLKEWCAESSVKCVILQPTMIYDVGLDHNLTVMKKFIQKFRFFPLIGAYGGLRQPVSASDLGKITLKILQKDTWSNDFMIFTVAGLEVMTFRQLLQSIFLLCDLTPIFIPVNKKIFNFGLRVLNLFGFLRNIGTEMIDHAEMDFVFDNSPLENEFDYTPEPFLSGYR